MSDDRVDIYDVEYDITPEELRVFVGETQEEGSEPGASRVDQSIAYDLVLHAAGMYRDKIQEGIAAAAEAETEDPDVFAGLEEMAGFLGNTLKWLGKFASSTGIDRSGNGGEAFQRSFGLKDVTTKLQTEAELARTRANRTAAIKEFKELDGSESPKAADLRQRRVRISNKEVNGTQLVKKIRENVRGSDGKPIFADEEARIMAAHAMSDYSTSDVARLRGVVAELQVRQEHVRELGGVLNNRGLLSLYYKLKEFADMPNGQSLEAAGLGPVAEWAQLLVEDREEFRASQIEQLEEPDFIKETIYVQPFHAEKIDKVEGLELGEIPDEELNPENIEADIRAAKRRAGAMDFVETERLDDFMEIYEHMKKMFGDSSVKAFRSLSTQWHYLPWYGIEITRPSGKPIVILESPIKGNATYLICEQDWIDIIQHKRTDAWVFGAKPERHDPDAQDKPAFHVEKITGVVDGNVRGGKW